MAPESHADFFEDLKGLVRSDQLPVAVEQLNNFLKGGDPDLQNEAVLLASRLARLGHRERRGELGFEQVSLERNRLAANILDFLDEVERRTASVSRPYAVAPVDFAAPAEAALEKIIGTNQLKSIAWIARGLQAARSVCRVVTAEGLGSGFLIEGGRLMTNHHVLADAGAASRSRVEFNYEESLDGHMHLCSAYELDPTTLRSDAELDFCVVGVKENGDSPPLESWGQLELAPGASPSPGEHVTIIQHPQGGPKQIAITANQVVNVFDHRLQYTTDTLPGSSGSPVFNDAWKVIALHHAGGNIIANERGDRMFANEGVLISYILDRLNLAPGF